MESTSKKPSVARRMTSWGCVALLAVSGYALVKPSFGGPRISSYENAAVATLGFIAEAQERLRSTSAMDVDDDGESEYGFLGELAGTAPVRGQWLLCGVQEGDTLAETRLDPSYLPSSFGNLIADDRGDGVVARTGYYFKLFLPGPDVDGRVLGRAESPEGGAQDEHLANWGAANAERMWCCYAWPEVAGETGNRVFCINQTGVIVVHDNVDAAYAGLSKTGVPTFDAAYDRRRVAGSMGTDFGIEAEGGVSNDGLTWTVLPQNARR